MMRVTGLVLVALALAGPGLAETIYRCDTDTGVVFSDQPCDERAQVYTSTHGLSVVPANERLAEVAAENDAFLRRQAEQRQAQRQAARARDKTADPAGPTPSPSGQVTHGIRVVPEWIQQDRRLQSPPPSARRPAPVIRDNRDEPPYSALSGRWPGTRREPQAPPEPQRPTRNPP